MFVAVRGPATAALLAEAALVGAMDAVMSLAEAEAAVALNAVMSRAEAEAEAAVGLEALTS